jgi:hypothetical protein
MMSLWESGRVYEQDTRVRISIDGATLKLELVCGQAGEDDATSTALIDLTQLCVDIENGAPISWTCRCGGRGWYATDHESADEGREKYCTCAAGHRARKRDGVG